MDVSYFDAVTVWLENNNDWLGVMIFLVALLESLVVVGIVVPGVAMLFALGAIAGTGVLDVYSTLAWAFAGAVVGDGLSYWLGYRYHVRLRSWWLFQRHPQWLEHGETFFARYGSLSVLMGRFVGPVRPMIPVVAGMMNMPPVRFYIVNIISALAWAPVYLLPGFFAGAALSMGDHIPDQLLYILGGMLMAAVILPCIPLWFQEKTKQWPVIGVALCFLGYHTLLIAYLVGIEGSINQYVNQWLSPLRIEWLSSVMHVVTQLGTLHTLLFLVGVIYAWSYYKGNTGNIKSLLFVAPAMEACLWLSKWLVDHPRPIHLDGLDPLSFPSGHTANAAFFLFWGAAQLGDKITGKQRWLLYAVSLFLVLLVAFSRLILNVHWIGDVAAGFTLGSLWVCVGRYFKS